MVEIADQMRHRPDSKARGLVAWIRAHLEPDSGWNDERVIVFTEYRDTLDYLEEMLQREGWEDRIEVIYGGMRAEERRRINSVFQKPDEETRVRILLATDAASEGADFQLHCRNLIHYEIPWNPIRLEQRNGRIDRHGQTADEVRVHHFVYPDEEDFELLDLMVRKVEAIRRDIQSVGGLIAETVERHALGDERANLDWIDHDERRAQAAADFDESMVTEADAAVLADALGRARAELDLSDERLLGTLRAALLVEGLPDVIVVEDDDTLWLRKAPRSWVECRRFVGARSPLTFDRSLARVQGLSVLHLDHPLLRRAVATLRAQMWSGGGQGLTRAAARALPGLRAPVVIAWGRLTLVGAERNRLHEGLVAAGVEVEGGDTRAIGAEDVATLVGRSDASGPADQALALSLLRAARADLEAELATVGKQQGEELTGALRARGEAAAQQARALATERMAEIRSNLRRLRGREAQRSTGQLSLFEDERQQLDRDIGALEARLEDLSEERSTEPQRQRALYRVGDRHVHPIAALVLLPAEGT